MEAKNIVLDIEYAILEQDIEQINSLFHKLKLHVGDQVLQSFIDQLNDLVCCICHGEYSAALQTQAAKDFFNLDTVSTEDIDIYITNRIKHYLKENDNLTLRQLLVLCVGIASLRIVVQQNWTGPVIDSKSLEYLPAQYKNQYKDGSLHEISLKRIRNGENLYSKLDSSLELLVSDVILVKELDMLSDLKSSHVWSLRCLTLKQRVMDEHSNVIMNKAFDLIKVIEGSLFLSVERNRSIACQLHLEIGHLYIYYYEMTKAKEHFTSAQTSLGMKFNLSGALGKRTKFQENFIPQLKLDVHHEESDQHLNLCYEAVDPGTLPKNVFLDDDLVLDKINFKDEVLNAKELSLNPLEVAVILSFCILSQKSQATQLLTSEELIAYIEGVVRIPTSWIAHTVALHMRSKLEKGSPRKVERSMMQLEVIVNAMKQVEPKVNVRQCLFYCLPLPPKWIIQDDFAQVLMSLGCTKTALDIYQALEMWENVINCLHSLGRYEKAEKMIRDQLEVQETSKLWCLLGDVTKDESCYKKAWEVSNYRSARAQRSLGLLHLRSKRYSESITCFQASLEINALQESIWFSMGCAAMSERDWELGKKSFHRCVALDSNNSKAWNNLANVYVHLSDRTKAHSALKEALRSEFNNWQMWENYLVISAQISAFYECIFAFHQLMDIKEKYKDVMILGLLVKAVSEGLEDNKGKSATRLRPELLKLMGRITSQITNDSHIWSLYAKLYEMTDSAEDKEKALNFLLKAHRLTNQAPNWVSDKEKFIEAIEMTLHIGEVSFEVSKSKVSNQQAIQVLSSTKLLMKQLIVKAEHHHKDSVTGEIALEIADNVDKLKSELASIVREIERLRLAVP